MPPTFAVDTGEGSDANKKEGLGKKKTKSLLATCKKKNGTSSLINELRHPARGSSMSARRARAVEEQLRFLMSLPEPIRRFRLLVLLKKSRHRRCEASRLLALAIRQRKKQNGGRKELDRPSFATGGAREGPDGTAVSSPARVFIHLGGNRGVWKWQHRKLSSSLVHQGRKDTEAMMPGDSLFDDRDNYWSGYGRADEDGHPS